MNPKTILTFTIAFVTGFALFIPIYLILDWLAQSHGIDRFYTGMTFGMLIPPVGNLAQLISAFIVKEK